MPVLDLAEARDVDQAIEAIVRAPSSAAGMDAARALFVERLDFAPATGSLSLSGPSPPASATRIAQRGGIQVVGIEFPTDGGVRASELQAALRQIRQTLNGEILLVATERTRSQWHFVFPGQRNGRDLLRRMVVHVGQPRRTVVQQLAGVYHEAERGTDLLTALEDAYDVEAVTKRFFQQYREIFERVMRLVGGLPDVEERKLFCQLLFNRLMFIYFLQRKGWLTFNGDADYLEAVWRDGQKQPDDNFYGTRLKTLFFLALNNPRDANWDKFRYSVENLIGRVPFLNGGLFAPTQLDERAGVTVPNEAIRLILRDLFAHFNFTITESTPYDIEVAVDPEMLGKVFEELVTGRHETGSYYTPRPIVCPSCVGKR